MGGRANKSKRPGADAARLTKASRRRGVSLVELMVVISIITILFGMVGVVFHRLFLSEQVTMRATLTERSVSRLAGHFRRDVHAATAATRLLNPETGQVSFLILASSREEAGAARPSSEVSYSIRENEVIREELVAGKAARREVYRLPECQIRFPDSTREGTVEMVGLIVERQGTTVTPQPQATRPRRSLVIEAALGRDAKLAAAVAVKSPESVKEESQ